MVPKQEFPVGVDDAYLDADDLEQILGSDMPDEYRPLQLEFHHDDVFKSGDVSTDEVNLQSLLVGEGESQPQVDQADGLKLFDLPVRNESDPTSVKRDYISGTSNTEEFYVDYLLDEPYFDATTSDFQVNGSSYLEADDLQNDVKTEPDHDLFDEYPTFLTPPTDGSEIAF